MGYTLHSAHTCTREQQRIKFSSCIRTLTTHISPYFTTDITSRYKFQTRAKQEAHSQQQTRSLHASVETRVVSSERVIRAKSLTHEKTGKSTIPYLKKKTSWLVLFLKILEAKNLLQLILPRNMTYECLLYLQQTMRVRSSTVSVPHRTFFFFFFCRSGCFYQLVLETYRKKTSKQ